MLEAEIEAVVVDVRAVRIVEQHGARIVLGGVKPKGERHRRVHVREGDRWNLQFVVAREAHRAAVAARRERIGSEHRGLAGVRGVGQLADVFGVENEARREIRKTASEGQGT